MMAFKLLAMAEERWRQVNGWEVSWTACRRNRRSQHDNVTGDRVGKNVTAGVGGEPTPAVRSCPRISGVSRSRTAGPTARSAGPGRL
jgi:hypothetical protein